MARPKYDVVVWGATGFTGKWVAKHLFDNYPQSELRWAIAGRDIGKLAEVKAFIGDTEDSVEVMVAYSDDQASLAVMAVNTKVIISTVGPYAYYGSELVKVCVKSGTHYVDLTGETPWIRRMIDKHQGHAEQSGARIVHCCGFDSIPSDMGTYYIQQQAMAKYGEYLKYVQCVVRKMKGGASGGTIHSMFNVMKEAVENKTIRKLLANPYSLNPDINFKGKDRRDQRSAVYLKSIGTWTAPFVMAAINTRVVRRGHALMGFPYGKRFKYSESMATSDGLSGRAKAMSIASAVVLFMGVATTEAGRKLLAKILPSQGEGPEVDPDSPGFYIIDFYGKTSGGEKLVVRLHGDADPGYGSTSKMLAESAVCLALNEQDLEIGGGFWTPASAMGDHLLTRLQDNAGLSFSLK